MDQASGRVLLAAPRGFCAGVDRAVATVEHALARWGAPIYVRGQIVHNRHVVGDLASRGVVFVDDVTQVPRGATLILSAHGVAPEVRQAAQQRDLQVIDATCPLVAKVHREALRFAAQGYQILLIGHVGHEETEGTAGEARRNITIIDPDAETVDLPATACPIVWLSQTTLSVDQTTATVAHLRKTFPQLSNPPSDDICYATQNRQAAVKQIAAQCDVVLVVGSANSSNSVRLVEVARQSGAPAAYRIDQANQLDPTWLTNATTVGLTSGASVPEPLVSQVLSRLAELGFAKVSEVGTTTEQTTFALPRELRSG
jgi:4-hydroxy-3-methylbut-2-enyl diphosphate reductase